MKVLLFSFPRLKMEIGILDSSQWVGWVVSFYVIESVREIEKKYIKIVILKNED